MEMTEIESGSQTPSAYRPHRKNRTTVETGKNVEIPGHAISITISDLSPLGDWVQVSWLEPVEGSDRGIVNELIVRSIRTDYTDNSPVDLPIWAVAPTLYEPPDAFESVIYWLE